MAELLAAGDYAAAAREIDSRKSEYGPSNEALYHLDLGLALHYAGRHQESAQNFEAAERRLDELYTKSVAGTAGRLLANENIKDYRGQPSDRALGQFFDALNYVFLGRPEEALVAVRRLEAYLDELARVSAGARSYTDDGLARYLAALLYQETGKVDDARISYEAARRAYARYPSLYGTGVPALAPPAMPGGMGEIVFLHYNGPAPRKISVSGSGTKKPATVEAAAPAPASGFMGAAKRVAGATVKAATGVASLAGDAAGAAADVLLNTAHPEYVQDPFLIAGSEIEAGAAADRTELYSDVSVIVDRDLRDDLAALKARSAFRATLKLAQQAATGIDASGSEFADVRSWAALPAQIRLARVALKPGVYRPRVRYRDAVGAELQSRELVEVRVETGRRVWVWDRTSR